MAVGLAAVACSAAPHGSEQTELSAAGLTAGGEWPEALADGTANVGVGRPLADLAYGASQLREMLDQYLGSLGTLGVDVSELKSVRSYQLPHSMGAPRWAWDRLALVGDAGSMVNPLRPCVLFRAR